MASNPGGQIGDLMTDVRIVVDDEDDGSGDSELRHTYDHLFRYFNRGEREIAFRTLSLDTDSVATVTPITLIDGTWEYAISNKIIYIKKAVLTSTGEELTKIRYDELRAINKWSTLEGEPDRFVEFMDDRIVVHRTPDSDYDADTLDLEAVILPLTDLSASNLSLSINGIYEDALVDYVISRCMKRFDSQTEDLEKATVYSNSFTARVGPPLNFNHYKVIKTQPEGLQFTPHDRKFG